jgi:hypothetical protein
MRLTLTTIGSPSATKLAATSDGFGYDAPACTVITLISHLASVPQ